MRLYSFVLCRRFLLSALRDKVSQGSGRLPGMPLSRHKAQYSLDCDDGIEYSACLHEPTPQELLERMEMFCRLWNALNSLPEVQGRRIDAHIILGKSIKEIAEAEGVHEESVRQSIKRGLERMKKTF